MTHQPADQIETIDVLRRYTNLARTHGPRAVDSAVIYSLATLLPSVLDATLADIERNLANRGGHR